MTFGNTRFIKPEFSVGGYPAENLLVLADPNSGSQYISGTDAPTTGGTPRVDPNHWALSDAADFSSVVWDNSLTSPNLRRGIALNITTTGSSATGDVFIETPLAKSVGYVDADKLYVVVDAYNLGSSGDWDVVMAVYGSGNFFEENPLAGGFVPFSTPTLKSACLAGGGPQRFYAVAYPDTNGNFNANAQVSLRFRHLAGSSGLIINSIYVSDTPFFMSGNYVPTWSNGSNVSLFQSPASRVQWSAVGDVVNMSGLGYLAFTSSPATIDMSLPLTTKFTSDIANADGAGNKDEMGGGTMFTRQNTCNAQTRCHINTGVIQWGIVGGTPTTNFFSWSAQYRLVNPGT